MPSNRPSRPARWLALWGGLLPLLVAEFIVWVGFGALLPVMPLYFTDRGVNVETLGIVIAAWPATRLVAEPVFGWIADRVPRVPLMVAGLVIGGSAIGLSLAADTALAFLGLRALAGLGAALYDPAARGYVNDATPAPRRGEAFGLYGAAQMGGLLLGPAIGGLGASVFGGVEFVFWFGAVASILAAAAIVIRVRELPRLEPGHVPPLVEGFGEFPAGGPSVLDSAASAADDAPPAGDASALRAGSGEVAPRGTAAATTSGRRTAEPPTPTSLRNPILLAAVAINVGGFFAGGIYEVIWSLFLSSRGAGLDLIGLTFAAFGLPVLLLSPFFGRLVDRQGSFGLVVVGSLMMAAASVSYPFIPETLMVIPVILLEATGFAMLGPALYGLVARGSPPGRSSTAQGIFGAAGTFGTIVAAVAAGYLAAIDIRWPFWVGGIAIAILLVVGLAIGGRAIRSRPAPSGEVVAAVAPGT